jgi:hypothetical protein
VGGWRLFQAFAHGVNVSAALTKCVGGHSDLLLGSVTVRDDVLYQRIGLMHQHLSRAVTRRLFMALRGLQSLHVRLNAIEHRRSGCGGSSNDRRSDHAPPRLCFLPWPYHLEAGLHGIDWSLFGRLSIAADTSPACVHGSPRSSARDYAGVV